MSKGKGFLSIFILCLFFVSGFGFSQQKDPGTGFFLKAGVGYSPSVTMKSETNDKISGGGMAAVLSLGWFLNERTLLYVEFLGDLLTGPELTSGGRTYSGDSAITANAAGFGVGIGYYLVPKSVFAGVTLTFASITMEHSTYNWKAESDMGIGVAFQLGKDFPVSQKVLVGIAARAFIASMKDKNGGPKWNTNSIGILATISWAPRGWTQ